MPDSLKKVVLDAERKRIFTRGYCNAKCVAKFANQREASLFIGRGYMVSRRRVKCLRAKDVVVRSNKKQT